MRKLVLLLFAHAINTPSRDASLLYRLYPKWGWGGRGRRGSSGAMVLGKLPVPGRPTNFD